jgi:CRISPR-associated protein Csb2
MGKDNRHDHAFYLSEDADEDGQIDHLVVLVPAGMDAASQRVLSGLTRPWKREGDEYRLLLESIGDADDFDDASRLFLKASVHVSLTPYLHPWHVKKKFPVEDQIKKECSIRGLPELKKLERLETIRIGGRDLFPLHFHRFRSKRGLAQPDRQGSFWRLTFSEPVRGPLAIGFGCHFGLGLFASEEY